MSINSALASGVSGLAANESAVTAISNNIANSNTVGFKTTETAFETFVTGGGGANPAQNSGGGVAAVAKALVSQQGQMTHTSNNTDMAISGNGFFVVQSKLSTTSASSSVANTNPTLFTRAGSFTANASGYLVNTAGDYLLGWPADADGAIVTTNTSVTGLSPINVSANQGSVAPTTLVGINANINAATTESAAATAAGTTPVGAGAYNPATNSMAAYNASTGVGVKPDFTITVPVSDSLGGQHDLQIDLLKSSTPNQWYTEIVDPTTTDVAGVSNGQIAYGKLAFTNEGAYDPTNSSLTLGGSTATPIAGTSPISLTIGASPASSATVPTSVSWASSLGVAAQTIQFGLTNITQEASSSAVQQLTTNGTSFGNLSSVTVDSSGVLTANYDNGVSRNIAQAALATFSDPDGLQAVSGNAYQQTLQSGNYSILQAGNGGAGKIDPSTLEASTVDLSSEFSSLIITQRAYSACSKVITTADQMVQQLLDVVR